MPLPQDIRPVLQDMKDTLVKSDAPWIEQSPMASIKVLWVGRESGSWATLFHWKKGYVAKPHKHLAGAHTYVISGKLESRPGVVQAGDYAYEPVGMVHDATTALEDTIYLFISLAPLLLFDDGGLTGYVDWEAIEKLREETVLA
jgi:quercetin dioxygenase-like cupin family protein